MVCSVVKFVRIHHLQPSYSVSGGSSVWRKGHFIINFSCSVVLRCQRAREREREGERDREDRKRHWGGGSEEY